MKKYIYLEHTADIKFKAFGNSLEEAFENSVYALKECILNKKIIKTSIKKKIEIKADDLKELLYRFLEEFLFLLDSERFIFSKIEKIEINEKKFSLKCEISGDLADRYKISNDVKAITYNDMEIKKDKNKWVIQTVLDV